MIDLKPSAAQLADIAVDAVVVGAVIAEGQPVLAHPQVLPAQIAQAIGLALSDLGVTGQADQVVRLPASSDLSSRVIAIVGMGSAARLDAADRTDPRRLEILRRAAGAATRQLAGLPTVAIGLDCATAEEVGAVAEGALLGAYALAGYKTTESAAPIKSILIPCREAPDNKLRATVERARAIAQAVNATRDYVNSPPNELYPEAFAARIKTAVKGTGVKLTVLDEPDLRDGGYGGIVGVGQGSIHPPRLVKAVWAPARPSGHVALVGKGITFDSGGLSLKTARAMETMKCDMAGAASVLGAVLAAAALKLPLKVTAWLALAENLPSGSAQRPSDVVTIRNGTTVEVVNTDAEGRLVLADAMSAAAEEKPDLMVDIATLTGAQVVALGDRVGAVMGTDEARAELVAAADAAGEQFWPMPLPADLRPTLLSQVADLRNSYGTRNAAMLLAGLFLKEFSAGRPWAHLDIAGPAYNSGDPHGYTPAGGTGSGVRTLLRLLEARAG